MVEHAAVHGEYSLEEAREVHVNLQWRSLEAVLVAHAF